MPKVIADALTDTVKLIPLLLVANVLIEVLEHVAIGKIKVEKALKGGLAPLIGTGVGMLPQCGFSVVAAKMYADRHITLGTLFAVFVATSDEAIPILLASPSSAVKLLPLVGIKLVGALAIGYGVSLVLSRREKKRIVELKGGERVYAVGCHGHAISDENDNDCFHDGHGRAMQENREETSPSETEDATVIENAEKEKRKRKRALDRYLWHPLFHTLTVSLYILAVNLVLGIAIYFVTEERLASFMSSVRLLQPVLAALVGLIPNCASSVAIAELYSVGTLSLGGAAAGLSVNAGLGLAVLLKENKSIKESALIFLTLVLFSVVLGTMVELILLSAGM